MMVGGYRLIASLNRVPTYIIMKSTEKPSHTINDCISVHCASESFRAIVRICWA